MQNICKVEKLAINKTALSTKIVVGRKESDVSIIKI